MRMEQSMVKYTIKISYFPSWIEFIFKQQLANFIIRKSPLTVKMVNRQG